ncbi:MAG: hypothetical protein WD872_07655 [Pirellulaceae bacterium]
MHVDLLSLARNLAMLDAKKPKQANLRRAVSSAYYGLFHCLVDECCRSLVGTQHAQSPYRHILGRAFEHATMKEACTSFAGSQLKAAVAKGLPASFAIPSEVKAVARAFADAQEMRHLADYDRSERFVRSDVLALVEQIEAAIEDFADLSASNEKKFFLICLLTWKVLAKR